MPKHIETSQLFGFFFYHLSRPKAVLRIRVDSESEGFIMIVLYYFGTLKIDINLTNVYI